MRCLIRTVTRTGRGSLVYQGKEYIGERITLGRAADQAVFLSDLRVALYHARITQTGDGRFLLLARVPSGVHHNDEVVQFAFLQNGDRIGLGNYEIRVIIPAETYDLILDVERLPTTRGQELKTALAARSGMGMERTGIPLRRWSWALFLGILALFLLVPLAGFYYQPLRQMLRSTPLPGDGTWDVGRLAAGHHAFGQDCNQCHQAAFVSVRDSACLECHRDQPDHVDLQVFDLAAHGTRCAACHKDHNGPQGLIRPEPALCTTCHGHLQRVRAQTELPDVTDFSASHPQFRVALPAADSQGPATRVSLDRQDAVVERSSLRFPHDVHLKAEGVRSPRGNVVLDCANCHRPQPGGARMTPIRFEQHCHECHKLAFETDSDYPFAIPPEELREVPHGNAGAVLQTLTGYYSRQALEGGYLLDPTAPGMVQRLRRPGERITEDERRAALDWSQKKAAEVGQELFEYRACAKCHSVLKGDGAVSAWQIVPVQVVEEWFPKAHFIHDRHKTVPCTDCHAARDSKTSTDVLMPGITRCRECHADPGAQNKLESTCISCHGFHMFKDKLKGTGIRQVQNLDRKGG